MTRVLPCLILLILPAVYSAEPEYPAWDGHEPLVSYAKKANLPPTKTLELGDNVKLELVLIPAGQFIMGTPAPAEVDEESFHDRIITGLAVLGASFSTIIVMLAVIVTRAIQRKRRPQLSLGVLMLMTITSGACVLSGMHWLRALQALKKARVEYWAAKMQYDAARYDEKPAHAVTLTKPFYMGKFEVTQQQYSQVKSSNPSAFAGLDLPADSMAWEDACSFCSKLSVNGRALRLPTEAEWEYACRAGTQTRAYSGDEYSDIARIAWCTGGKPRPIGQKEANAFGLHDMLGNVWEWCRDWYGNEYATSGTVDPKGPSSGRFHVIRGGSWMNGPDHSRSASRWGTPFGSISRDVGFRVVMEVPEKFTPEPDSGTRQ